MLRSAPMAVLSSPVSRPPWPRCAVAGIPGTASALRPEPRARLLLSLRTPALLSASWGIPASVSAARYAIRNLGSSSTANMRPHRLGHLRMEAATGYFSHEHLNPLSNPHLGVASKDYLQSSTRGSTMKIVVIGGTGLIGSKTVAILRQGGHEVVAASPKSGINTITGQGLKDAIAGAQVVIDLANSPSFEDKAVLEFFETSGRNLLPAEAAAAVRHHVALSIVGDDRAPDIGYFRAKVAREKLIETSGIPYTIIRSTQFLEFLRAIADSSADGNMVRLSPGLFQPIAADDVATGAPESGRVRHSSELTALRTGDRRAIAHLYCKRSHQERT